MSTKLIQHPYIPPADFAGVQPGVHKASTVFFPSIQDARERSWLNKDAYTYGLHGTPTSYTLEQRLCTLEGGTDAVLLPSGLAAIACVNMAILEQGDEVLIPDNAYGPNKDMAEGELARWGIIAKYYDPLSVADLEAKITDDTRLVWLEAAGSVTLEFPDLVEMVRLCRSRDILTVLDNTWGAGLAFQPFDLLRCGDPDSAEAVGVDISMHALTKYPSGGGDVLMGSVVTRNKALSRQILLSHMRQGYGVGMNDVEAILRGLPSIELRYDAADRTTRQLAQWCSQQPQIAQVLHPALPDSPGHAFWKELCVTAEHPEGRAASLLTLVFEPHYTQEEVDAFCNQLQLFRIGYSWGGPMSLVMAYDLASMRQTWPQGIARGHVVRLVVGLENANDLQADIEQALQLLPA